jgi:hypothetical protein
MNHEIQELLDKAAKTIAKTGTKPGTRYPKSLKKIVISLRLDHNMSVKDITKHVGVSAYSAREWPKTTQNKKQFNKISVVQKQQNKAQINSKRKNYFRELELVNFNLKVVIVLINLLIFESVLFRLFY